MENKCMECGAALVGRSDKKFCSDGCRNAYHNRNYRKHQKLANKVNRKLEKNRRILQVLYSSGQRKVPAGALHEAEFDFSIFTSVSRRFMLPKVFHCYEYSYYRGRGGTFIILRK